MSFPSFFHVQTAHPWFNEPGYAQSEGTPQGTAQSKQYNDSQRYNTLAFSIYPALHSPPRGFEAAVRAHYRLKKEVVRVQAHQWLAEYRGKDRNKFESIVKSVEQWLDKL